MRKHGRSHHKWWQILTIGFFSIGLGACVPGSEPEGDSVAQALLGAVGSGQGGLRGQVSYTPGTGFSPGSGYMKDPSGNQVRLLRLSSNSNLFPQWAEAGNPDEADRTYIARVSQPSWQNVEYVVFLTAGLQKNALGFKTHASAITGQKDGWNECSSCDQNVTSNSYFKRLYDSGRYPLSKTLFVLVYSHQHKQSDGAKNNNIKLVDFYTRYIAQNVNPAKLKLIHLAGSSKGGILVTRIANRLKEHTDYKAYFQNVPLIMVTIDPTVNYQADDAEMVKGVDSNAIFYTSDTYKNYYSDAIIGGWKAKKARVYNMFGVNARKTLAWFNVPGGQHPAFGAYDPFIYNLDNLHNNFNCTGIDLGWHRSVWTRLKHTEVGGEPDRYHWNTLASWAIGKHDFFLAGGRSPTAEATSSHCAHYDSLLLKVISGGGGGDDPNPPAPQQYIK